MTRIAIAALFVLTTSAADFTGLLAGWASWSATNDNPYIVFVGDSTQSGYAAGAPTGYQTAAYGDADPSGTPAGDTNYNIAGHFRRIIGLGTFGATNLAAAGRKWGHTVPAPGIQYYDFFVEGGTKVFDNPPKYIVVRAGINNISSGDDFADIEPELNNFASWCLTNSTKMVLQNVLPFNSTAFNLASINLSYSNWVATNVIGTAYFYNDFDAMNEGDGYLPDIYAYQHHDSHMNTNGYAVVGTNVASFFANLEASSGSVNAYGSVARVGSIRAP